MLGFICMALLSSPQHQFVVFDVALPSLPCGGVSLALALASASRVEREGADDGFAVVLLALSVAVLYTCPGFTVYYFEEVETQICNKIIDGK